ncbi:MAG: DUF523 domain-containing protein [Clostridia bacterium]|nr:DUF523 domain-containing protein [Clostridia bacterium]
MIVVSACLAGVKCRYDGKSTPNSEVQRLIEEGKAVTVCPEVLGGCCTPRPATEIAGGTGADVLDGKRRVINNIGEDVTEQFVKGAEEVLKIAETSGAKKAILKARSPSCGCGIIYDGTFTGKKIKGNGVTAELLLRNGIEVLTEEDL